MRKTDKYKVYFKLEGSAGNFLGDRTSRILGNSVSKAEFNNDPTWIEFQNRAKENRESANIEIPSIKENPIVLEDILKKMGVNIEDLYTVCALIGKQNQPQVNRYALNVKGGIDLDLEILPSLAKLIRNGLTTNAHCAGYNPNNFNAYQPAVSVWPNGELRGISYIPHREHDTAYILIDFIPNDPQYQQFRKSLQILLPKYNRSREAIKLNYLKQQADFGHKHANLRISALDSKILNKFVDELTSLMSSFENN